MMVSTDNQDVKEKLSFILCNDYTVEKLELIHYGNDGFDPKMFIQVRNAQWVKPNGGLWTSPINSTYGWKQWCEAEDFRVTSLKKNFTLKLSPDSKVVKIDSTDDLMRLPLIKSISPYRLVPDFELLTKHCDAIWLTEKGQWSTRYSIPANLYGWDCETVLILNKKAIHSPSKSYGPW